MTLAHYAPHIALCAAIATLAALCHHHGRQGTAGRRTGPPRRRTTVTERIPLDDLTSDQLDALYDRAEGAEAARDRLFRSRDRQAARAKQAKAEAARLRTAWTSARHRAAMYLKSNQNFAASLDNNHAAYLQLAASLAKSEQGRRNLRGLLEHHRDQGALGILRTTRTRLTRALKACARYRAEVSRLTAGQPDDYEQTTGHEITCCAGFTNTCTCTTATPPVHLAKGTNAEDCPACEGTNPDYPFLCPGPATA